MRRIAGAVPRMSKNEDGTDFASVPFLACLEGFEPATFWFVAKHSIRLSYRHMTLNCFNEFIL